MNIPTPNPDEHVLGLRGRLRLFNHHPNVRHTISELRAWTSERKLHDQPIAKNLPQLMLLAKAFGMDPREFSMRHSSIPFIRAFLPDAFDPKVSSQRTINIVGLYGLQSTKKGAWFCPDCVVDDIKQYGMPYWRRTHQLPGANWCVHHNGKLLAFSSHSAFDKPPPVRLSGIELLHEDGPHFLQDTCDTIQKYSAIAKALLERPTPLSAFKLTALLRRQALASSPAGGTIESFRLQHLAEQKLPEFWQKHFYQFKGTSKGKALLDFDIAFRHSAYVAPTALYVIALALLFKTVAEALRALDEAENFEIVPDIMRLRKENEREFWSSDYVLNEYSICNGSHESFSNKIGMDFQQASNALRDHGLPDLSNVAGIYKTALLDFFKGASVNEISVRYSIELSDFESLLRIAGSRFGHGLDNIN